MRILYLDTTSSFLYCGVVDNNNLLFEIKQNLEKNLSTLSLQKIKDAFDNNKIETESINKIIVVSGPGSFTGIRIGLTIAKTWAWSKNIPIVPISSLDAIALSSSKNADFFIPIIDARRGYVYSGIYDSSFNSILKNQYIKLDTLKIAIKNLGDNYTCISNDYFDLECEKYDPNILKIVNFFKDKESVQPHEIDALYLKKTEAEENLEGNLNDK